MNGSRFTITLLFLVLLQFPLLAQEAVYHGKFVKGSSNCPVLIKLKKSSDGILPYQYIMPTGALPANFHIGDKIVFTMTPLRQPIPNQCKAGVVASITIMQEELKKSKSNKMKD